MVSWGSREQGEQGEQGAGCNNLMLAQEAALTHSSRVKLKRSDQERRKSEEDNL